MLDTRKCYCPYCGESIEIVVDLSEAHQEYIEDCSVCCRAIIVNAIVEDDDVYIDVRSENE